MFKKKIQFSKQLDSFDCGPACIKMISEYYGKKISLEQLRKNSFIARDGVSIRGVQNAAESVGFKTIAIKASFDILQKKAPLPLIALWNKNHFIVIHKITNDKVFVADPAFGLITYSREEFEKKWIFKNGEGYLLLFEPTKDFYSTKPETKDKKGIRLVFPYFKPFSKTIIQLIFGLFAATAIQIVIPFLTKSLVDYGINLQKINFVNLILIVQITFFAAQTFVRIVRDWLLLYMSSRINLALVSDFLKKVMKLPLSFFDSKVLGDIINRVEDHKRVETFISVETLNIFYSALSFIVFGTLLAVFSLKIFFVFLLGTVLYIAWVFLFLKKRAVLNYKNFDEQSQSQTKLIELIQGMKEIKLNNSDNHRRMGWERLQIKLYELSIQTLSLVHYQTNGGVFISEIKKILIVFIAAQLVIAGDMTLGTLLAIQYIMVQLNNPIRHFITFIQSYQDARISLERIEEIHQLDEEYDPNALYIDHNKLLSNPDQGYISIQNLFFRYGDGEPVLKNLNIKIPKGKITAIVGASGSGKTTLLKLLLKFYKPTSGVIKLNTFDLESVDTKNWRQSCGAVMQDGFIFGDSILNNILESKTQEPINYDNLNRAIKVANLQEVIEKFPQGLNTQIGSSGISLSGGQTQRILIARAVYKSPEYLFFDEATSALDANNEKIIMKNLYGFFEGKTVLIIAHRLSTVKNADQILVLDEGEIKEFGDHDTLVTKKDLYFNLIKNQLELGD